MSRRRASVAYRVAGGMDARRKAWGMDDESRCWI